MGVNGIKDGRKKICFHDSMGSNGDKHFQGIIKWLGKEAAINDKSLDEKAWKCVDVDEKRMTPKQIYPNGNNFKKSSIKI